MINRQKINMISFWLAFVILNIIPHGFLISYYGERSFNIMMPIVFIIKTNIIFPFYTISCILLLIFESLIISKLILWIIYKKIDEHKENIEYNKIKNEEKIEDYDWKVKKDN